MSIFWQIMLAFGSVGLMLGVMAMIRQYAPQAGISPEVQRKIIHVCTGMYALSWPWLFPDRWPAYMLVGVTLIVMIWLRLPRRIGGMGAALHGVDRRSYGDILLAIAIGLCLFLGGDRLALYVLPVAVLTFADAAAALVGSHYATRFFKVEDGTKSVEGCVTFCIVTLLISLIVLLIMTPLPPSSIIVISLIIAGFGTLVEAASWRGFDNLFLPVGLQVMLSNFVAMDMAQLMVRVIWFTVALLAFRLLARWMGMGTHVARVYVTMIFLLLAATTYPNALIPILVLFSHLWCRRANPGEDRFPELDAVAGLTLVSLGWLAVGQATGWSAVNFYAITAMGICAGFCALALAQARLARRIAGLGLVIGALFLLRGVVVYLNPDPFDGRPALWVAAAMTMILTVVPTSLRARLFHHDRVTKVTALALIAPCLGYLFSTGFLGLLA